MVDRKTMLANAEEKIEEHPVATAAAAAGLTYLLIKLGSKKEEDDSA
jgi:hypothetical protein